MCFFNVFISFLDVILCGVKVVFWCGKIVFNFDDDYIFGEGDEVIVIVVDYDFYILFILILVV